MSLRRVAVSRGQLLGFPPFLWPAVAPPNRSFGGKSTAGCSPTPIALVEPQPAAVAHDPPCCEDIGMPNCFQEKGESKNVQIMLNF